MFTNWPLTLCFTLPTLAWAAVPPPAAIQLHNALAQDLLVRSFDDARLQARDTLQANATFGRSWDGAVLLKFSKQETVHQGNQSIKATESIEIICTKCYVQGVAKARVDIPDDFNATYALNQTINAVAVTVENVTTTAEGEIKSYFKEHENDSYWTWAGDTVEAELDDSPLPFPQMNLSFDVDLSSIPQVSLNFEFDGLEIYAELDTVLNADLTYTLNLYTSDSALGIGIGGQQLGITFTIDLIISADAAIDINSGFHLKFEDGLGLNIALFNNSVAKMIHNGGQFETLPITVDSAGVVFQASLRIGVHAGIAVAIPDGVPSFTAFNHTIGFDLGGGIETSVFATIVDLISSITHSADDAECDIRAVEEYQFNIGAAYGATVHAAAHTWGPHMTKQTAVYTKTLDHRCVIRATSSAPPITSMVKRRDLSTTTTAFEVTRTGVQCQSSIAGNCPASLQVTSKTIDTTTLTTAVSSGAIVVWPKTPGVADGVVTTVPFNDKAIKISATSGFPTAYTAPAIQIPIPKYIEDYGPNKKLILGLCIGLAMPIIIVAIIAAYCCVKRHNRRKATAVGLHHPMNDVLQTYEGADKTQKQMVQVREVEDRGKVTYMS